MTVGSATHLYGYVETVVDELLHEEDPDEERWETKEERQHLINQLAIVIDGRASDWYLTTAKGEELPE